MMKGMHVFIDDSGDTGFNFSGGSSRFVVMAACVFREDADIERAAQLVRQCKERNRHGREFRYSKTKDVIKDCFFECTTPAQFALRTIVIDKASIKSEHLRKNPRDLKSFAIKQLLTHHDGTIVTAKVVIDGQDSRPFGMTDQTYFTKHVNREKPNTVREVDFVDSKVNLAIQIADMSAGAIHRFVREDEKHSRKHFEMLAHRTRRNTGGSFWRFH